MEKNSIIRIHASRSLESEIPCLGFLERRESLAFSPVCLLNLDRLLTQPGAFADLDVAVTGRYLGWSSAEAGPPPVTRSDWLLGASEKAIYVTGRGPENVAQGIPPQIGQSMRVVAVVRLSAAGQPYLEVHE